jgi:hypothetical protein
MSDQEIRAKALEIAVLIKGPPRKDEYANDGRTIIIDGYLPLAGEIERYIRSASPDQKQD